ncbi:MAG: hypothetical protein R2697_15545 [Ilumatobacteraceae bacterium]
MAFRIVLGQLPAPAVRLQIADLVGEEHIVDVDGRCVVVPDQAAAAGISDSDLGCRLAEMASDRQPGDDVHPDRV